MQPRWADEKHKMAANTKPQRTPWLRLLVCVFGVVLPMFIIAAIVAVILSTMRPPDEHHLASRNALDARGDVLQRIQSRGTWNGTGISVTEELGGQDMFYLTFQDHLGDVYLASCKLDETNGLSLAEVQKAPINANKGTGLALFVTPGGAMSNITSIVRLVYVTPAGVLADISYQNATGKTSWQDGDLSSRRFRAPTDLRPAMLATLEIWDLKPGTLAFTLFAGGTDGLIHRYAFRNSTQSWYPVSTHEFRGSSAYGGIAVTDNFTPEEDSLAPKFYRTLVLSDSAGSLQSHTQTNSMNDLSTSRWPTGGPWGLTERTDEQVMLNTGFAGAGPIRRDVPAPLHVIIAGPDGTLKLKEVSVDCDGNNGEFGAANSTALRGNKAMPGSDFSVSRSYKDFNKMLFFYQEEGSSLAWMVLNGDTSEYLNRGRIVLNGSDQWEVKAPALVEEAVVPTSSAGAVRYGPLTWSSAFFWLSSLAVFHLLATLIF